MNDLDAIKSSQSASFKKRNPHIFPSGEDFKPVIQNAGGEDDAEHDLIGALMTDRKKPAKKRIRQATKPLLNKLENEWFEKLKHRYRENNVHITTQAIRFSLGNGIAYKPDFVIFWHGKTLAFECKGPHAFRGGFENLKVAASKYPMVLFVLVWKSDGQWQEQHVLP